MPAQTLSVYLPADLYEKVKAAEAENAGFKATEFCKAQLTALFDGDQQDHPLLSPSSGDEAATEQFEYEIQFKDTVASATAYLNDAVRPNGGYPISVWTDHAGRVGILVGWPQ